MKKKMTKANLTLLMLIYEKFEKHGLMKDPEELCSMENVERAFEQLPRADLDEISAKSQAIRTKNNAPRAASAKGKI